MSKSEKAFYRHCSCSSELLEVSKDDLGFWNVTIWKHHSGNPKFGVWERLRWAWSILVTGNPFGDEIMLTAEDGQSLANFMRRNHVAPKVQDIPNVEKV